MCGDLRNHELFVQLIDHLELSAGKLKQFIQNLLVGEDGSSLKTTTDALQDIEEPLKQLSAHRETEFEVERILPAAQDLEKAALTIFQKELFETGGGDAPAGRGPARLSLQAMKRSLTTLVPNKNIFENACEAAYIESLENDEYR